MHWPILRHVKHLAHFSTPSRIALLLCLSTAVAISEGTSSSKLESARWLGVFPVTRESTTPTILLPVGLVDGEGVGIEFLKHLEDAMVREFKTLRFLRDIFLPPRRLLNCRMTCLEQTLSQLLPLLIRKWKAHRFLVNVESKLRSCSTPQAHSRPFKSLSGWQNPSILKISTRVTLKSVLHAVDGKARRAQARNVKGTNLIIESLFDSCCVVNCLWRVGKWNAIGKPLHYILPSPGVWIRNELSFLLKKKDASLEKRDYVLKRSVQLTEVQVVWYNIWG